MQCRALQLLHGGDLRVALANDKKGEFRWYNKSVPFQSRIGRLLFSVCFMPCEAYFLILTAAPSVRWDAVHALWSALFPVQILGNKKNQGFRSVCC